jgi:hypothetical protein
MWIGIDWGVVGGILLSVAVILLSILTLYAGPKVSTIRTKRLVMTPGPELNDR